MLEGAKDDEEDDDEEAAKGEGNDAAIRLLLTALLLIGTGRPTMTEAQEVAAIASNIFSSCWQLPDTPAFGWELRQRLVPICEFAQHNAGKR